MRCCTETAVRKHAFAANELFSSPDCIFRCQGSQINSPRLIRGRIYLFRWENTRLEQTTSGYASDTMYRQRWELIKREITEEKFTLIDWGSDSGWFSISAATEFSQSSILAVDGSVMLGEGNIQNHLSIIAEKQIQNDILINCLFDASTFAALKQCPVQYQLVLSVFHWILP